MSKEVLAPGCAKERPDPARWPIGSVAERCRSRTSCYHPHPVRIRLPHVATSTLAGMALTVACGARTGLLVDDFPTAEAGGEASIADDAPGDSTAEASPEASVADDGRVDSPPEAGLEAAVADGPADSPAECSTETYCDPGDPAHIYLCGQAIAQCGLLEQCEMRQGGAQCVNPCLDSLGNDTSNGCDFYAVEMDTTPEATGVCYAVFVVNQWKSGEPARLEVTLGGTVLPIEQFARIPTGTGTGITYGPFSAQAGLPKDQIAILFLSRDPSHSGDPEADAAAFASDPSLLANCPPGVTPAVVGDAALHGTGTGTAFHIQTNVPIVAYQMLPYGGGHARVTGSTLLLPTSAWDTNYVVADAYEAPNAAFIPEVRAGPTTVIIASQDATTVTLKPTVDILAGGSLSGTIAGAAVTYTLNQGQYLQFTQRAELTGSALQSDKPVAVVGGSTLMDVPVTTVRADTAEQMLPPVRALGSEYVAVRYRNRGSAEEVVPWRIVGVVDGTVLTYDPPQPGAPAAIDAQQWIEFDEPGPFVVRSQDASHPFYVAAYMTGGCGTPAVSVGGAGDAAADDAGPFVCPGMIGVLKGFGDPEFLNVVPPAQYLPHYTFFTDPTYPETNLVVVRVRDTATMQMPDVTLDCTGVLGGWQAVGSSGAYEMTRVDLSTGNFQGVGNCNNGVHTITAVLAGATGNPPPTPLIGVTIWGWGNDQTWPTDTTTTDETNPNFTRWVSYGYPAGANFKPLNSVVLLAQ
jgi:hypothetical protein